MSEQIAGARPPGGEHASGRVAVVVVNWNGRDDTLACLASLQAVEYAPLDILVVDNGSTDGSVAAVRAEFAGVSLIETGRNLGFAGGNNVGIEAALAAGAEFVLLLNNDTVVSPALVGELVSVARAAGDVAAVSPKIYYQAEPRRVWYAGSRWVAARATFEHVGQGTVDDGEPGSAAPVETEYACGCAMLLPAAALHRVGLLDLDMFLLYEETDWCFRARRAGLRCLVAPRAHMWHKVSASFGGRQSPLYAYFDVRNRLLWAERYLPLAARVRVWLWALARVCEPLSGGLAPLSALARLHGRAGYWEARAWLRELRTCRRPGPRALRRASRRGLLDYLRRRFGDCPPRVRVAPG
jgi:GT2 family glycosyltransferase